METGSIKDLKQFHLPTCEGCGQKPDWTIEEPGENGLKSRVMLSCDNQFCGYVCETEERHLTQKRFDIFQKMVSYWIKENPNRKKNRKINQIEHLFGRV